MTSRVFCVINLLIMKHESGINVGIVLHQLCQREVAAAVQLSRVQVGAGGVRQGESLVELSIA
jgi:hypothetical protein